jgi:hypothetical protein
MLKKSCLLILLGIPAIVLSSAGPPNRTAQTGQTAYPDNHCVSCHSKLIEPLRVSNHYFDWHRSMHKEKGVGCEKCHGGDPTIADSQKAHAGVLKSSDPQSRLHPQNLPETCGACHRAVVNAFVQSTHYQRLKGPGFGPTCTSCHVHMATTAIYSPQETAVLCSHCHNTINGMLPPRPEIPERGSQAIMAIKRANGVVEWANLLLAEGRKRGLHLDAEQDEMKMVEALLSDAKLRWHTFATDAVRRNADAAFIKGAKVKDALSKKVILDR